MLALAKEMYDLCRLFMEDNLYTLIISWVMRMSLLFLMGLWEHTWSFMLTRWFIMSHATSSASREWETGDRVQSCRKFSYLWVILRSLWICNWCQRWMQSLGLFLQTLHFGQLQALLFDKTFFTSHGGHHPLMI